MVPCERIISEINELYLPEDIEIDEGFHSYHLLQPVFFRRGKCAPQCLRWQRLALKAGPELWLQEFHRHCQRAHRTSAAGCSEQVFSYLKTFLCFEIRGGASCEMILGQFL